MSASAERSYGRGAAILSVGIGVTGLVTFAYFSLASHALPEDEYGRKVRTIARSWGHIVTGRMFGPTRPLYLMELISHRVLRYASGFLHVGLLATSIALVAEGWIYQAALAAQALWLALAAAGKLKLRVPGAGIAYYYLLMSIATMVALARYLREGAPMMWEKAEGTR